MKTEDKKGFSLVELLVVTLLLSAMMGGGYLVLATGQAAWLTSAVDIELQDDLRKALQRVSAELMQTNISQQQVYDGTGYNNSDVVRFSVPVVCETGGSLIDSDGDVAHWGAPLTWGCTDPSCMDKDNDCTTVDYMYVEYELNNSNQIIRRVLKNPGAVVAEQSFVENISDFQIVVNGNVFTLTVSAQKTTASNRIITGQKSLDVYLRN